MIQHPTSLVRLATGLQICADASWQLRNSTALTRARSMWMISPGFSSVAAHRFGRLECRELVDAGPLQDASDGRRRHADFGCNLLARVALAAQCFDHRACGRRCLAWQ